MPASNKPDESESVDNSTEEGKEPGDQAMSSMEGVQVPEQFQSAVSDLLDMCNNTACLDYLSSQLTDKRGQLSKESDPEFSDDVTS